MPDIYLAVTYTASAAVLFAEIQSGRLFELTGADTVTMDFTEGGTYLLEFEGGGTIRGSFLRIVPNQEVSLSWSVEGFRRIADIDSRVLLSFSERGPLCTMALQHTGVSQEDSARAKERAWREILSDLKHEVEALKPADT